MPNLRHDHRLALRQPEDEGRIWRSIPCRDGRECRRGISGQPRGPGPVRRRKPAPSRRRPGQWPAGRGDRRRSPSRSARAIRSSSTRDEHPRETSVEALARLKPIVREDGSVTAGNASGVNDGAAALIVAIEGRGREIWPDPARQDAGRRRGRRSAADHGHRPGAGDRASCSSGSACRSPTSTSSNSTKPSPRRAWR